MFIHYVTATGFIPALKIGDDHWVGHLVFTTRDSVRVKVDLHMNDEYVARAFNDACEDNDIPLTDDISTSISDSVHRVRRVRIKRRDNGIAFNIFTDHSPNVWERSYDTFNL